MRDLLPLKTKNVIQNRWLLFSLRMVLGAVFIVAAVAKIQDIAKFVSTVVSYGILPVSLAHLYGNVIPWVELFIGCALILGVLVRFAAALLAPLVISFIIAGSSALQHTIGVNCGCFGTFLALSHPVSLILDGLILIAAFILLLNSSGEFLSIVQLLDRLRLNNLTDENKPLTKYVLPAFIRVSCVGLVMVLAAALGIGMHEISKPAQQVVETMNLPTPISGQVDNALLQHKPVLIEVYADGCGLCEAAAPVISSLEEEFTNEVMFIPIDYYTNPAAVSDIGVMGTPTVLVIVSKNSKGQYNVVGRFQSFLNKTSLESYLEQAIKSQ
jgi:thiol-disulfide isomerase/thioredoxin